MPHNLYLHSALVKDHVASRDDDATIGQALRGVNIDTFASLGLVVAAAVFHAGGYTQVDDLADAQRLIAPLVGSHWAAIAFAAALLACGLNATVTGTLAGQAVMEGFLQLKIKRWARAVDARTLDRAGARRGGELRTARVERVASNSGRHAFSDPRRCAGVCSHMLASVRGGTGRVRAPALPHAVQDGQQTGR